MVNKYLGKHKHTENYDLNLIMIYHLSFEVFIAMLENRD
jgi:hypothetical protein